MSISVPSEFDPFIRQQVAAGFYPTEQAVVSAALRLLEERERKLAQLREELRPALEAMDRGEVEEMDVESLKQECRDEIHAQQQRNS